MMNRLITAASFGVCFAIALAVGARGQQLGGGGVGTPCTATAISLQYNNSGVFGCATEWLYTSAKKSLGDGANFQMYWSAGNGDFDFRNTADNAYIAIRAGSFRGNDTLIANLAAVGPFGSYEAVMMSAGWRQAGIFANSAAQIGWSSTTDADSGTKDTAMFRNAAGVIEFNNGTTGSYREAKLRSLVVGGTVPGISGCTAGTQTGGATAGTFVSGTTGVCTVVLTFAFTAPTGWSCAANNQTTANLIRQSASSTTTATVVGTTVTSDIVNFHCMAY